MKAVITGASSGMGKYFAIELAKKGYDIVVVARREEKLKELVEQIEKETERKATYIKSDLSIRAEVLKLGKVIEKDKEISFLANNAGIGYFGALVDMNEERVNSMINLNINALTTLTVMANKAFASRGGGKILNVASVARYIDIAPANAPYAASKHYVDVLSRSVNFENKKLKNKVKVISLKPGAIATEWALQASGSQTNDSYKGASFVTKPDVFAKRVIRRVLRGSVSITSGAGGYSSKLLSGLFSKRMKSFMWRYGSKEGKQ